MKRRWWRGRFALRFHSYMYNGHPGELNRACKRFIVRGIRRGLVVTSTTDGTHAANSYHFQGMAVDLGLPGPLVGTLTGQRRLRRFQRAEARHPTRFLELFGPINDRCVRNGQRIALPDGSVLENAHDNHVHGALR